MAPAMSGREAVAPSFSLSPLNTHRVFENQGTHSSFLGCINFKCRLFLHLSPLCFMWEIRGLGHRDCANIMCTGQDRFESETVKFKTIVGTLSNIMTETLCHVRALTQRAVSHRLA